MFRVAASGRIGFGHLTRALHLADALGVPARLSLRGSQEARGVARARGADLLPGTGPAAALAEAPDLLVIDDPSCRAAGPWLRAARRRGVAVVSVHDLGIAPIASDLAFDGSLGARRVAGLGRSAAACRLGARYAMLDRAVAAAGSRRRVTADGPSVVIGLGGGRHAAAGIGIARLLREAAAADSALSGTRVLLSLGFNRDASAAPLGLDLIAPDRFRDALAVATVAVVAGGQTLYEACALGTPAVAVPVVSGQALTVRRFGRAGLAVAVGGAGRVGSPAWVRAVGEAAMGLLRDPGRRRTLAARGQRAIDGRGAARAAREVERLLARRGTTA